MLEFIVTSDLHIGSGKNLFPDILSRQLNEIYKIYDYALDKGIDHIIIAGDISDKAHLNTDEILALVKLFCTYDGKINTYYIAGNHDYHSSSSTSLDIIRHFCTENLIKTTQIFVTPEQLELDGVIVNFIPFPHLNPVNLKRNCINIVHVDTAGSTDDSGRITKCKDERTFGKRNITISGHIHKYQVLHNGKFIFCGNPYQKTFGEKLPKGFIVCRAEVADDKLRFTHKFIDNKPDFRLKTVHIENKKDLNKIVDNSNIAYRITKGDGVVLPSDISNKHNIVSTKHDTVNVVIERSNSKYSLTTGLKKYLKDCGIEDSTILEAISNVKETIKQYSL